MFFPPQQTSGAHNALSLRPQTAQGIGEVCGTDSLCA